MINLLDKMERRRGIEPLSSAWKAVIIPLYYRRWVPGKRLAYKAGWALHWIWTCTKFFQLLIALNIFMDHTLESPWRSLAKTFCYRILAYMATVPYTGPLVALEIHIILAVIYYFHERAWSWIGWGRKL
jgi:uncharacterized membrane protein